MVLNNLRANSHPPNTDCSGWNLLAKTEQWTQGQSIRYSVTIISGLIDSVYLQSACTKLSAIRHPSKYFYISPTRCWLLAAGWCWWGPQWQDHGLMAPGPGYVSSVLAISFWHFYQVLNNMFILCPYFYLLPDTEDVYVSINLCKSHIISTYLLSTSR